MTRTDRGTIMIADYDFGDVDIERAIAEEAGFALDPHQCKSEEEVIRYGRDADGILTQYVHIGATATRHGIQVTNAPNEWCAEEVADHAIALWLCAARKINRYDAAARAGEWRWQTGEPIWKLRGHIFGILGFGAIAQLIAERAEPFGVELRSHDPFVEDEQIRARGVRPVSFDELIEGSDYLVIQAPLTPDTYHLFDRTTLGRMKSTAILVNTARGPIIEDAALADALVNGTIAGAALDDLEEEPAKHRYWQPTNPLLHLPNSIVTPHAAYYSEESVRMVRTIATQEAVRVLTGHRPQFPVNTVSR